MTGPRRAPADDRLTGRRVLVTGGSGFIGGHLLHRLVQGGARVHAVSRAARTRPGVHWERVDLTDAAAVSALVAAVRPEVVLHLASEVAGARDLALVRPMLGSLAGTVHLLTAAAEQGGARVVLAGSVEEPRGSSSWTPTSPYAAAKWAATGYARMFHAVWGLPTVVLRVAMTYGPAQPDESKLVPYVIRSLLDGRAPAVGSGTRLVDWVHVDDVADAFLAAACADGVAGREVDVASGEPVSIRHTVDLLARLTGVAVPPRYGAVADRPLDAPQIADPTAARELMGWRPSVGLEDGMARTVAWYREHRRG